MTIEMNQDKRKLTLTILGGFLLYLASVGVSFAAFRYLGGPVGPGFKTPEEVEEARARVDLSAPKTEACPLNGGMFTKAEKKIWERRRPLTVMIENHAESRPQSGLASADVVYEAVAEGAITRFLAVYYCGASAQDTKLAPVRSARVYFIDWASEYGQNPLYVHVGGANNFCPNCPGGVKPRGTTDRKVRALEMLVDIGWRRRGGNDLDPGLDVQFPVFARDYDRLGHPVPTEHTMASSTDKLWEEGHKRGFNAVDDEGEKWDEDFTSWKFKKDAKSDQQGNVDEIKLEFWSGYEEYAVRWQYDQENNRYLRFNGGEAHKDLNNDEQIAAKVVVIQMTQEQGPVDEEKHIYYRTTGKGQAIIFQDGQAIKGTWTKASRESRTKFTDSRGKEIELNRGPIWIEIIPHHQEVQY